MMKLTPKEAARKFCIQCLGLKRYDQKIIEDCQGDQCACGPCPLYPYRTGKRISVRVFRQHCLYCMGGKRTLVSDCETTGCELYPYRRGTNPALTGRGKGINPFVARVFQAQNRFSSPEA